MWCLVTSRGQRLPIRALPAVVGRHKSADIVVDHESIEPHHARLTLTDDGSLFITVLDDALVEVEGWRLGKGVLAHGDELLMGTVTMRLVDDSAPRHGAGEEGTAADREAAARRELEDAGELQLRREAQGLEQRPAHTHLASQPRRGTTQVLRGRQPAGGRGLLHAEVSQLAGLQKAVLVAGILALCAALVWGLSGLIPLLF